MKIEHSDRGFAQAEPVPGEYGGHVRVYESSASSSPHVWLKAVEPVDLNDRNGPTQEATIHLTAESAWLLAEQLRHLVRHHYQGRRQPERRDGDMSGESGHAQITFYAEDPIDYEAAVERIGQALTAAGFDDRTEVFEELIHGDEPDGDAA